MRVSRLWLATACMSLYGLMLNGCGQPPPTTVMSHSANDASAMGYATASGEYLLYTSTPSKSIWTVQINQGDPLGFRRADDGRWIAGDRLFTLPPDVQTMYWKYEQPGQ